MPHAASSSSASWQSSSSWQSSASVLANLAEAFREFNSGTRNQVAQTQFYDALLKTDAVGKQMFGNAFTQAADFRFAHDFHYALMVERASVTLGCVATREATPLQLHPTGPDLSPALILALEATQLQSFADAFWDADLDHFNMWNLNEADLAQLGMAAHQIQDYLLYVQNACGYVLI
jgi:hypothetical protein